MSAPTTSSVVFNGTKLDMDGVGLRQWLTDIYNHITIKWGPDVTRFVRDKILPTEHTQCAEQRYKISAGGQLVANKMPGMIGTFAEVDKKISRSVVDNMTAAERNKLKKIGTNYYGTAKRNIAADYAKLYENDPFINERVQIHSDHLEMLTKFESDWVSKLAAVAADVGNWLTPALKFRMECMESFCTHRNNFRPEIMVLCVVDTVVSANAGEVIEKTQMSIISLGLLAQLLSPEYKLGEEENIDVYLNKYDEAVQRLYVLGCNNRDKALPAGEDIFDYIIGVNLIRSVAGHKFDDLIAKDDNDKLLKAPICSYVWAKNRVKKWSDELQSSFKTVLSNKSKKRSIDTSDTESAFKKATIMMERAFDHANQLSQRLKSLSGDSGKQTVVDAGTPGKPGKSSYDDWKKTRICRHCNGMGHFDNECTKATAEERAAYLAEYQEKRKLKKSKQFSKTK
jgi:hypothetical protein